VVLELDGGGAFFFISPAGAAFAGAARVPRAGLGGSHAPGRAAAPSAPHPSYAHPHCSTAPAPSHPPHSPPHAAPTHSPLPSPLPQDDFEAEFEDDADERLLRKMPSPLPTPSPSPITGPQLMRPLVGECYQFTGKDGNGDENRYEVCGYKSVRQTIVKNGHSYSTGYWAKWLTTSEGGTTKYTAHLYNDGESCGSVRRQTTVVFECDKALKAPKLLSATEPAMCAYELRMALPQWCEIEKAVRAKGGGVVPGARAGARLSCFSTHPCSLHALMVCLSSFFAFQGLAGVYKFEPPVPDEEEKK
jgi:hypothetical protein